MKRIEALSLLIFGKWVGKRRDRYLGLQVRLREAHITKPIVTYVSVAYSHSITSSIICGMLIGYVFYYVLFQDVLFTLAWVFLFSVIFGFFDYYLFLRYPGFKAKVRKSGIDTSLPYAVAYMHAMSKGGMNIIDIFKSLSERTHIFMEAAEEVSFIVRDMTFFGFDVMSALYRAGDRTPSQKFKDFIENLMSIIDSGGDITAYFQSRSDQYQNEALEEQKGYLDTLGMVAESYVTTFVAGPLFLITILIVMGISGSGSTKTVEVVIYLIIPVGSLMFITLLSMISISNKEGSKVYIRIKELDEYGDIRSRVVETDDEDMMFKELRKAEDREKIHKFIKNPFSYFYEKPFQVLYISIPASIFYFLFMVRSRIFLTGLDAVFDLTDIAATVDILDEYFVITILILLGPFALFREIKSIRIKRVEEAIPTFLKRLASINEAGITLTRAIGIIVDSNLGVLSSEIKKIWKDISWGRGTSESLIKFEKRVKTTAISRTITLITKASEATGNIREVLNIASRDAEIGEKLKRARSSEMSSYVVLIYMSFFVFLVIIYILSTAFLSIIPTPMPTAPGMEELPIQSLDINLYNRIFFHAVVIQGFFSGLIAGEMGEGSVSAGVKHSVIMVAIAYTMFALFMG